jgi:hypothetical protein
MNSILTSIKKMLGLGETDTHFDTDIIININTALATLTQIGVGPKVGFRISDKNQTWSDLLGTRIDLESVKTFIYLKVRLVFDPPTNAFLVDAIERQLSEISWRISNQAEEE